MRAFTAELPCRTSCDPPCDPSCDLTAVIVGTTSTPPILLAPTPLPSLTCSQWSCSGLFRMAPLCDAPISNTLFGRSRALRAGAGSGLAGSRKMLGKVERLTRAPPGLLFGPPVFLPFTSYLGLPVSLILAMSVGKVVVVNISGTCAHP